MVSTHIYACCVLAGTWRSCVVAPARRFIRVSSDVSVEFAATLCVNPPTAYRMLKDFVSLQPGIVIGTFYALIDLFTEVFLE